MSPALTFNSVITNVAFVHRCRKSTSPSHSPTHFNLPSRFFLSFPKTLHVERVVRRPPLYLQTNTSLIFLLKDWKIHKPFCRPNAPCSVIIDDDTPGFGATTKHGALSIPITNPDGTTRIFSSSTMNAEMMKEIKAHSEADGE